MPSYVQLRDEDASKASLEANWFSASSVLRVYGQYLALDRDHNGMLSPAELARCAARPLLVIAALVIVMAAFMPCHSPSINDALEQ